MIRPNKRTIDTYIQSNTYKTVSRSINYKLYALAYIAYVKNSFLARGYTYDDDVVRIQSITQRFPFLLPYLQDVISLSENHAYKFNRQRRDERDAQEDVLLVLSKDISYTSTSTYICTKRRLFN